MTKCYVDDIAIKKKYTNLVRDVIIVNKVNNSNV